MNDYGEAFLVLSAEPQEHRERVSSRRKRGNVSVCPRGRRRRGRGAWLLTTRGLSAPRRTQTPLDMAVLLLGLCPTVLSIYSCAQVSKPREAPRSTAVKQKGHRYPERHHQKPRQINDRPPTRLWNKRCRAAKTAKW